MNLSQSALRAARAKRAALDNLTGVKEAHHERAQELWKAKIENREAAKMRFAERDLTEGHHLDLYPTPAWLAAEMVSRCDDPIYNGALWCDPEAGTGRIIQAMFDAGHWPTAVELNYNAAEHLKKKFPNMTVINKDFLELSPHMHQEPERIVLPFIYNVFIMNPPFSNGQDIKHVMHAYECLAEAGRIVAIMSEASFYRSDRLATEFQAWFYEVCGESEKLDRDTFKASGTCTATRLVQIDK